MTGRGEDMLRFPRVRLKRRAIRRAIRSASHLVALSREIARAFEEQGADPGRISVIPNGVDTGKFRPLPQAECRRKLGLPLDAKIILSVGDRLELKGFHLLVEALPAIRQMYPNAMVGIVGGPGRFGRDYSAAIRERIAATGMSERVLLAGARPQDELPLWYNAADVFALLSSREGSPNVLLEAMACGRPAVATAVGGIPDELGDYPLGILLTERTIDATTRAIARLLQTAQDGPRLDTTYGRTWAAQAERINSVFRELAGA
jgi:glycosyltransferase involved in cell wall biosynthesis